MALFVYHAACTIVPQSGLFTFQARFGPKKAPVDGGPVPSPGTLAVPQLVVPLSPHSPQYEPRCQTDFVLYTTSCLLCKQIYLCMLSSS